MVNNPLADDFNEETQRSLVGAGYKGGDSFSNPILHPAMTIKDTIDEKVKVAQSFATIPSAPMEDPWYGRHTSKA